MHAELFSIAQTIILLTALNLLLYLYLEQASMSKIEESRTAAAHLMRTIEPILLQRKKCEHTATLKLKKKVEMVVWIPLSTTQRKVYEMYLRNRTVQDALERKNFAVDVINDLKTISRHPFLKEASESLKKISGKETGESRTKSDTDYGSLEAAFTSMTLDRNGRGGRGAADDEEDEDEDDNYNIGRAKDSRFNTSTCKQRGLHALPARTTRPVKSSTPRSCQRNRLDGVDCQSEDDEADRSRADRKVGANASVFEIAGREPDVEELFQVRGLEGRAQGRGCASCVRSACCLHCSTIGAASPCLAFHIPSCQVVLLRVLSDVVESLMGPLSPVSVSVSVCVRRTLSS